MAATANTSPSGVAPKPKPQASTVERGEDELRGASPYEAERERRQRHGMRGCSEVLCWGVTAIQGSVAVG